MAWNWSNHRPSCFWWANSFCWRFSEIQFKQKHPWMYWLKSAFGRRNSWLQNGKVMKHYMDVSENSGTPKSSILIRFSIINHPFWGTPIFGNTHITNLAAGDFSPGCQPPVFWFHLFRHDTPRAQRGLLWRSLRSSMISGGFKWEIYL